MAKKTANSKTATKAKKTSKAKKPSAKPATRKKTSKAASAKEAIDPALPVERREGFDRRQETAPVSSDRRKVQRRRQIDPTTCERDYTNDEIEFMQAMDDYKRKSGRMFPTCSEILEVVRSMGYERVGTAAATVAVTNDDVISDEFGLTEETEFSS